MVLTSKSYDILEDDIDNDIGDDNLIIDISFQEQNDGCRNVYSSNNSPINRSKAIHYLTNDAVIDIHPETIKENEDIGLNKFDGYDIECYPDEMGGSSLENSDDEFLYEKYISPNTSFIENTTHTFFSKFTKNKKNKMGRDGDGGNIDKKQNENKNSGSSNDDSEPNKYNGSDSENSQYLNMTSDGEEYNMDSDKLENMGKHKQTYKKLTYNEIEKSLTRFYEKENKYSNELNLLTTYVKGQKHLYMQSQYITQLKLYVLTIVAMTLTASATVITPFYSNRILISGMNGLATLLITIINYLKLESTSRMYLFVANQYDMLENTLELANNKVIVLDNEAEQTKLVLDKLRDVEYKISEIKTIGKILVPDEIASLFPVIMYINIFSFIKKMEFYKKGMIMQFRDVKNEIRYIFYKWKHGLSTIEKKRHEKIRLDHLLFEKNKIKNELITYQNAYAELDDIFTREIKYANSYKYFVWCMCCCIKTPIHSSKNTVINEYIKSIS